MPGKDDDSTAPWYSATDNLCEHTAKVNILFILKLLETSVKIGHNCNSLKYHGKNKQSMFFCEAKNQKSEIWAVVWVRITREVLSEQKYLYLHSILLFIYSNLLKIMTGAPRKLKTNKGRNFTCGCVLLMRNPENWRFKYEIPTYLYYHMFQKQIQPMVLLATSKL